MIGVTLNDRPGLVITEKQGFIIFINENAISLLGLSSAGIETNFVNFIHEQYLASFKKQMRYVLAKGSVNIGPIKIVTRYGEEKLVRSICFAANNEGNKAFVYLLQDSSFNGRSYDESKALDADLLHFVNNIGYPVVCINRLGEIITTNTKCEQKFGWGLDDLSRQTIKTIVPDFPRIIPGSINESPAISQAGRRLNGKFVCKNKNGTGIECNVIVFPWSADIVIVMLDDLIQDKLLLKELQQKDRALDNLNTAVTVLLERYNHEKIQFNERISANIRQKILPYVDLLKQKNSDIQWLEYLEHIETGLKDITSPFANKIESKEFNLSKREIEIANLIKNGKSTKEIAKYLRISMRAIDSHRYNLRKKLGINRAVVNLCEFFRNME